MKTFNDIYMNSRRKLRAAGIAAYDLETRLILSYASGKTREEYVASSRMYVTDPTIETTVNNLIDRRLNGEPVAYLVGEWEFYGLPMVVNEHVLIPRVDTELLAQISIERLKKKGWQTRALDLCAGSGCVGLALAANVPGSRIVLADISERALAVCRLNMLKNNLSRQTTAIEVDVTEPAPSLLGRFDIIVSNPPYIKTMDMEALDKSVKDFEPQIALDGGPDGLYYYRAITTNWPILLKPGGNLAFECGIGQAADVANILEDNNFKDIATYKDTGGIDRVVVGTLKD